MGESIWLGELRRALPGDQSRGGDTWAGVAREGGSTRYRIVTAPGRARVAGLLVALIAEGLVPVAIVDLRRGRAWRTGISLSLGSPLPCPEALSTPEETGRS